MAEKEIMEVHNFTIQVRAGWLVDWMVTKFDLSVKVFIIEIIFYEFHSSSNSISEDSAEILSIPVVIFMNPQKCQETHSREFYEQHSHHPLSPIRFPLIALRFAQTCHKNHETWRIAWPMFAHHENQFFR